GVRANPLADLAPRELQTLSLLAQGKSYGRIAEELNVSYKTVVNACSQLKQKLNAKNLPELIRAAVQLVSAESSSMPASAPRPTAASSRAHSKLRDWRRLLQEPREGTARGALELFGVDRAVIVGIGSVEAFLHEREKFILVQSSVVVGVGGGKILGVDPAAQFALVEGAVVIAVELVEQLRGCILRFGEIDRAVVVRIERF